MTGAASSPVSGAAALEVRPARPAELAEAGRVTRAAYSTLYGDADEDGYLARVADTAERARRTTVLVAVDGGRVLGSVTLELSATVDLESSLAPDEAHLRMLGVSPDAQRRGVGRALVGAAAEMAREAGKRRLTLATMPEMQAAQRLYESMGFVPGAPREVAPGLCCLTYCLPL